MTATVITPSVVQKTYIPSTSKTGTPIRLVRYYLKVTKAYQSDWVLLEAAIGKTVNSLVEASGIDIDSSGDMAQETLTYDDSDDKLILGGATVGTAHVFVIMSEA